MLSGVKSFLYALALLRLGLGSGSSAGARQVKGGASRPAGTATSASARKRVSMRPRAGLWPPWKEAREEQGPVVVIALSFARGDNLGASQSSAADGNGNSSSTSAAAAEAISASSKIMLASIMTAPPGSTTSAIQSGPASTSKMFRRNTSTLMEASARDLVSPDKRPKAVQ